MSAARPLVATAPIRVVAFDLMDTLVHDPYLAAIDAGFGLSLAELGERRPPNLWPAFERDELDEQAYWDAFATVGIDVDVAAFHAARLGGYRWLDGMAEHVAGIREAGLVVLVASNYPVWIRDLEEGLLRDGDGRLRVDDVVVSCRIGARKPDGAFYDAVLDSARRHVPDVRPDEIGFLDDRAPNVDAARAAGFDGRLFTGVAPDWRVPVVGQDADEPEDAA